MVGHTRGAQSGSWHDCPTCTRSEKEDVEEEEEGPDRGGCGGGERVKTQTDDQWTSDGFGEHCSVSTTKDLNCSGARG